ncbi:MAG: hypothetical protein ABIN08_17915 [Caldimonas sp.]
MLLLVALPLFGLSGVLAQLLGTTHVHRPATIHVNALEGWQDFRRIAGSPVSRVTHSHAFWQKHQHGVADKTVVALGVERQESAQGDAATSLSAATALHAPARRPFDLQAGSASSVRWPLDPPELIKNVALAPPERPPRA